MNGAITPLIHVISWRSQRQIFSHYPFMVVNCITFKQHKASYDTFVVRESIVLHSSNTRPAMTRLLLGNQLYYIQATQGQL